MQSSKTSKKTLKIADDTIVPAPESGTALEGKSNTRTTRSSKPKKETVAESGPAKTHRKLSTPVVSEAVRPAVEPIVAKAKAAAAAARESAAPAASEQAAPGPVRQISQEEIARLAHSYWVERGYTHGSSVEDWLRAERELKAKALQG
jgi:hypothetical protein